MNYGDRKTEIMTHFDLDQMTDWTMDALAEYFKGSRIYKDPEQIIRTALFSTNVLASRDTETAMRKLYYADRRRANRQSNNTTLIKKT